MEPGNISNYVGIGAGVFTGVSLLPQLVKIIKEKNGDEMAFSMLLILLTGLVLWIWYGVLKTDWPIIITNSFSLLVNITIIVLKLIYKHKA